MNPQNVELAKKNFKYINCLFCSFGVHENPCYLEVECGFGSLSVGYGREAEAIYGQGGSSAAVGMTVAHVWGSLYTQPSVWKA